MKILLFCSVLAFGLIANADENASIAGEWRVHVSVAGNESDQVCTFTQKDEVLGGNCTTDKGKVEISGTVAGKKVAWSYKSEYEGTPLTVKFDGAIESGTKISGSVDVPEFGAGGDFTATQGK